MSDDSGQQRQRRPADPKNCAPTLKGDDNVTCWIEFRKKKFRMIWHTAEKKAYIPTMDLDFLLDDVQVEGGERRIGYSKGRLERSFVRGPSGHMRKLKGLSRDNKAGGRHRLSIEVGKAAALLPAQASDSAYDPAEVVEVTKLCSFLAVYGGEFLSSTDYDNPTYLNPNKLTTRHKPKDPDEARRNRPDTRLDDDVASVVNIAGVAVRRYKEGENTWLDGSDLLDAVMEMANEDPRWEYVHDFLPEGRIPIEGFVVSVIHHAGSAAMTTLVSHLLEGLPNTKPLEEENARLRAELQRIRAAVNNASAA